MPAAFEEEMRKLYLEMIESSPDDILRELAWPLKEELARSEVGAELLQAPGGLRAVSVLANGVVRTVEKEVFSIGRAEMCDIFCGGSDKKDLSKFSISRIQCWIFNFQGALMIVDGWSLMGTALMDRETAGQELPASLPRARRAFLVPHGEAITLRVGQTGSVTLNPKLCTVCLEQPRSVRLQCGHQAFCAACASDHRLDACPLCRATIEPGGVAPAPRAACAPSMFMPPPASSPDVGGC